MRAATMAVVPPYVTELSAPAPPMVAIENEWSASRFGGPFYLTAAAAQGPPSCSLVLVQSADGNTVASDPALLGGGKTDKHVVYEGLSRVAADAVLAGAGSVRGHHTVFSVWHPQLVDLRQSLGLPRHPVHVIATLTGLDIDNSLLFNVPEVSVVVLTVPGGAATMQMGVSERPWIRMITMDRAGRLGQAIGTLRALGIQRISCIGGRTLATELLDLDLIDDVYLTTAPRPGGLPGTPFYPRRLEASVVLRKRGTDDESGVMFEHLHLRKAATRA